jgi:hypothetical protein
MARELTVNAGLQYEDSEESETSLVIEDLVVNVSTKKFAHVKQNIGTSEEALDLGEITSLGYAIFVNRDSTNFVTLKTGTGGTVIIKLLAGEVALFRFGSGVTAPFAIADTAACQLEYVIFST